MRGGPNQQKTEPIPPSSGPDHGPGDAESGDVQGVPVPSEVAAEGTSEAMPAGVVPAIAPDGLADGETDVTMPRTSTF